MGMIKAGVNCLTVSSEAILVGGLSFQDPQALMYPNVHFSTISIFGRRGNPKETPVRPMAVSLCFTRSTSCRAQCIDGIFEKQRRDLSRWQS